MNFKFEFILLLTIVAQCIFTIKNDVIFLPPSEFTLLLPSYLNEYLLIQ